jgi:hypothetical protein
VARVLFVGQGAYRNGQRNSSTAVGSLSTTVGLAFLWSCVGSIGTVLTSAVPCCAVLCCRVCVTCAQLRVLCCALMRS